MKRIIAFSLRFLLFMLPFLVAMELFFRFVIPASSRPLSHVDPATGLEVFDDPGTARGTFSYGRLCTRGGYWELNDHGWNSMFQYRCERTSSVPRVALIGDSYVLGLWIDQDDHIEVAMDSMMAGGAEVYSFGVGGKYLLSHIMMAKYVNEVYDPDLFVIFVNRFDVERSLGELASPEFNNFQLTASDEGYRISRPSSAIGSGGRIKRRAWRFIMSSATLRYLVFNANLNPFSLGGGGVLPEVGNDAVSHSPVSFDSGDQLGIDATEWMLDYLEEVTSGKPVLFVGDGPRHDGSDDDGSGECPDCEIVRNECSGRENMHYLDLGQVFADRYAAEGRGFSLPGTGHWNGYGNRVVAEAVHRFIQSHRLMAK